MSDNTAVIRIAIERNDLSMARRLIKQQAQLYVTPELYVLAAQVATTDIQAENFLRKALDLDPYHEESQRALRDLRGAPKPEPEPELIAKPKAEPQRKKKKRDNPYAGYAYKPEYAGFVARFFAHVIDGVALSIIGGIIGFIAPSVYAQPSAIGLTDAQYVDAMSGWLIRVQIVVLIVSILYYVVFLSSSGQTPGKAMLGIRVISKRDRLPNVLEVLIRSTIGYTISALFFFLGYIWASFDGQSQAWHDKLVNTIVVKD